MPATSATVGCAGVRAHSTSSSRRASLREELPHPPRGHRLRARAPLNEIRGLGTPAAVEIARQNRGHPVMASVPRWSIPAVASSVRSLRRLRELERTTTNRRLRRPRGTDSGGHPVPGYAAADEARDGEAVPPSACSSSFRISSGWTRAQFGPVLGLHRRRPSFSPTRAVRATSPRPAPNAPRSGGPPAIAYSFKTNFAVAESHVPSRRRARGRRRCGAPVADLARRLGYAGEEIVFRRPYKRDDELRNALRDGALIHRPARAGTL